MTGRSRWPDALVAALATAVAGWSVTPLLREQTWVGPLVVTLLAIAASGSLARALRLPAWAVVSVQGVLAGLVVSWQLLAGHWYGLPTPTTLGQAVLLWGEGLVTIRDERVPVPAEPGLILVVVVAMAAVGLAVDAIGVTARSPALAGVPLLVVGTVTASNTGEALHPWFFVSTALAWLLLVARQGFGTVRSWAGLRTTEMTTSVWLGPAVARSRRRYSNRARVLVAVTVALAALTPALLPHLPTTTLVQGLARAAGGTTGPVTFTETLDLAEDLGSRSETPVLRFRTDSSRPSPLRVTVSTQYVDGRWLPSGRQMGDPPPPEPLLPEGLDIEEWSITVVLNRLVAPQVAVPHPLLAADFGEIGWGLDPGTGTAVVADQPQSYEATSYRTVGTLPAGTGAWQAPELEVMDLLTVDPAPAERVRELARAVTEGSEHQLDAAHAIQSHLSSDAYVYSLTLADPVTGPDGRELDPVSHFLETRQGYCTQFATAMILMSRSLGIPARLAVGFLPGEEDEDGARTVVAADAHAWPELYISGLGWTRFEPTPSERAGNRPLYYVESTPEGAAGGGSGATPLAPEAPDPGLVAGGGAPVVEPGDWRSRTERLAGPLLVVGVAAAVAALVLPLAARRRRRLPLRRAREDVARIEGYWHLMLVTLEDLGVDVPRGTSPRRTRELLAERAHLAGTEADDALGRVAARVERSRYAPGPPDTGTVAADVAAVVAAVRRSATRRTRLRAALVPRSGVALLREAVGRAAAALRAGARWVGTLGLQPSSSRSRRALRTAFPPPSLLK